MPKIESVYCLKCGCYMELVYTPVMTAETKELFNEIVETGLCPKCLEPRVKDETEYYLN